MTGFTINAVILVASGLLGLLLLWPNTERARLMARRRSRSLRKDRRRRAIAASWFETRGVAALFTMSVWQTSS